MAKLETFSKYQKLGLKIRSEPFSDTQILFTQKSASNKALWQNLSNFSMLQHLQQINNIQWYQKLFRVELLISIRNFHFYLKLYQYRAT